MSGFISVAAVTHYAIASRLSLYFLNLMVSSFGLLSPVFSQYHGGNDNARIKETFILGTKLAVSVAIFVALSLILYGDKFIGIWMGNDYLDAYAPLVILVIGMLSEVTQLPSMSYLQGLAKNRFLAYTAVIEGSVILTLGIYLAPIYGLIGVAFGSAIPMIIMKLCVQPLYICRNIGISLTHYYIRILALGSFISGFALFVPWIILFRNLESNSYWQLSLLILSQSLIAVPIVYMFVFDRVEKSKILSSLFGKSRFGRMLNPYIIRDI